MSYKIFVNLYPIQCFKLVLCETNNAIQTETRLTMGRMSIQCTMS